MGDGYLGKCKECTKSDTKKREQEKLKNPNWHESEKERQREKYHRLNYREKHKPSYEIKKKAMGNYKNKYPEKAIAKNKTSRLKAKTKGNHLHHWSYNLEDAKDVIELSVKDHNTIHRFLKYDQEYFFYRDLSGNLLNTREKHIKYIISTLKNK